MESNYDFDEKLQKIKKKKTKQQVNTYRHSIYCRNYYIEGHYTKECKFFIEVLSYL